MKNTKVELKERTDYDVISITLPNGAEIRIQTSKSYNEIEVTHIQHLNEVMVVKPMMGNQFAILATEVNY